MTPLILNYFGVPSVHAWLDGHIHKQVNGLPWHLELPSNVRRQRYTADVILGLLREDESVRNRCTPYLMLNARTGFKVRLDKTVLHQEIIPLLWRFQIRGRQEKENLFLEIRHILIDTPRVIHVDRNHLNCQQSNLRELSYEPLEEASGLYNEGM